MGLGYKDIEDGQISRFILIKSHCINGKILAEGKGRGSQATRGSQDAGQWVWLGFFFLLVSTLLFAKDRRGTQRLYCSQGAVEQGLPVYKCPLGRHFLQKLSVTLSE